MRRLALTGLTLLLTLGVLAGCSTPSREAGVDEDLDVYGAKKIAQQVETELAGFVPADRVASSEQLEEGVLISCSADGAHQWTGRLFLTLNGELDTEPIVDAVAAEFTDRPSYTAKRETLEDGVPSVHVIGPHGAGWLMALNMDRTTMEILSFSPCFRLPDGVSPRGKY